MDVIAAMLPLPDVARDLKVVGAGGALRRPVYQGLVSDTGRKLVAKHRRMAWSTKSMPVPTTVEWQRERQGTMTSRSMGSTWTPRCLSQLTPRWSVASSASISSATHP